MKISVIGKVKDFIIKWLFSVEDSEKLGNFLKRRGFLFMVFF